MEQIRLQLFMHEILSERDDSKDSELSDEDGSKGLPHNKNGDSCSHKVFHQSRDSKLSDDDDVGNNYLVNQSISESVNASSGQMLW
jgi:hypothetical protein